MAERFYLNCPLAVGPVQIRDPEARHLTVVCRLRAGDQVCLFNGDGNQYLARIHASGRKCVDLEVLAVETPARELRTNIHVAAPVPKGDRAQFLIEKLTELGVASFAPLNTQRSVVKPGEGKIEKLERYVIEASKQCGRNVLLRIEPPAEWTTYCRRVDLPAMRLVAHPGGTDPLPRTVEDMALAVGPEGGFIGEEVTLARESGWRVVNLGPTTLRIETAAILLASWAVRNALDSQSS
jgi:16S rRNA (uracil1498-N3)-methyltransferase